MDELNDTLVDDVLNYVSSGTLKARSKLLTPMNAAIATTFASFGIHTISSHANTKSDIRNTLEVLNNKRLRQGFLSEADVVLETLMKNYRRFDSVPKEFYTGMRELLKNAHIEPKSTGPDSLKAAGVSIFLGAIAYVGARQLGLREYREAPSR